MRPTGERTHSNLQRLQLSDVTLQQYEGRNLTSDAGHATGVVSAAGHRIDALAAACCDDGRSGRWVFGVAAGVSWHR